MQRRLKAKGIVRKTLVSFNQKAETALKNIGDFHRRTVEQPITNSLIVSIALDHYCAYLLNALKNAQAAGDEYEVKEALQSLAGGELRRRERMRDAS